MNAVSSALKISICKDIIRRLIVLIILLCPLLSRSQISERKILANSVSISLPVSFTLMDSVSVMQKYPPNNKPSEVYTNKDATVNIAFKRTNQIVTKEKIYSEGKNMETQMVNSGRIQLIKSGPANKIGKHNFSFYTSALDTRVYNIMFVFSVKGKMVVGSFNCTSNLQGQWEKTAYEVIESIKPLLN